MEGVMECYERCTSSFRSQMFDVVRGSRSLLALSEVDFDLSSMNQGQIALQYCEPASD